MTKISLPMPDTLTLSGQAAEKLIKSGDGEAALLYLHILATRGGNSIAETANELRKPEDEVRRAMRVLAKLGLILMDDEPETGSRSAAPRSGSPAAQGRQSGKKISSEFTCIVNETEKTLGRTLSSDDLERLFGIYDKLKLPSDVIIQLVYHCTEESSREKRRPTMRYIEKAAYAWERNGVFSLDRAEKYIHEREERRSAIGEVRKVLKLPADRELSQTERQYIETWLSLGFKPDAVAIAYDRTVTNTGDMSWKYLDAIINDWHGKNLHGVEEILTRDVKSGSAARKPSAKTSPAPSAGEIERMNQLIARMKQGDKNGS